MGQTVRKVGKAVGRRWIWKAAVGFFGLTALGVVAVLAVVGIVLLALVSNGGNSAVATPPGMDGAPKSAGPGGFTGAGAAPLDVPATGVGSPDPAKAQSGVAYTAPAAIDFDGDPRAYAPADSGLPTSDFLANAGRPGNWWGIETDTGRRDGNPKIGPGGYYISQTSLRIGGRSLNAQSVPFVALPQGFAGARLGDYVLLVNNSTGQKAWAIFGDVSPKQKLVEMSPAAARQIGVGFTKGGTTSNAGSITATVYPGTANLGALSSGN